MNPDSHLYPERSSKTTPKSKIPCVTLDTDVITDAMAARLAMSLLGHILFMKSQVPFPVIQLARMPNGNSNARALKKRADLLASFDTLASHLQTTFTALSTAMARSTKHNTTASKLVTPLENRHRKFGDTGFNKGEEKKLERAYLAMVFGPSASSAKARVLFAVDGLEVKIWGQRDDMTDLGCGLASEDEGSEEDEGSDGETESESSDDQDDSDSESDWVDESSTSTDSIIDGSSSPPPQSRSPSPTSSLLSDLEPPTVQRNPVPISTSEAQLQVDEPPDSEIEAAAYASQQQAFLKAERLLSRTLASACAEDERRSIACELAPTQTHILLRAPRRFSHPAWTPKQNLVTTMEGVLANFLEDSGLGAEESIENDIVGKTKRKKGSECEGIWIRCQGLGNVRNREDGETREEEDEDEEDEMIWWTWDGKIVGFSDW